MPNPKLPKSPRILTTTVGSYPVPDWLAALPPREHRAWKAKVEAERIERRGLVDFFTAHPDLKTPLVLAPITAHYSWSKGMKLLGLGRAQLRLLPECEMRVDIDALERTIAACERDRRPVLLAVGVLGTTEYGTVDPIDGLVDARDAAQARGFGFGVHVDAAWGGYLATLFRNTDGSLRPREEVAAGFARFPQPRVHAAVAALARTDSITIDPHKLGYLPYGAGAFLCRDHRAMALLAESADYVFHDHAPRGYRARYRNLGQFIPEGSKPGANAAAVYVTHKVLPLDHANFGMLPAQTVQSAEAFHDAALAFAGRVRERVQVVVPFPPDSNLVCVALNPAGNSDIAAANAFTRRLHDELRVNPSSPLQDRSFFGSVTMLRPQALGEAGVSGTWNLVADGQTSWHGFAEAIFAEAVAAGLLPRAPRVVAITTADYPTPARRPAYSCLDTIALQRDFGVRMPSWRPALRQVLEVLAAADHP